MKTKDLINLLHQYDSTGEKEVLISNHDIDYIIKEPMYQSNKGYVITKRKEYKQKQPTEITISSSKEKINLVPIDTFEYYRKKIINDQEFITIKTENDEFYWESPKLFYNKLYSLTFCKEYLNISDKELYPYKDSLIIKITEKISELIAEYKEKYLNHCLQLQCESKIKDNFLTLIDKFFSVNKNVIFNLPLVDDKKISIKTTGIKNFKFETYETLYRYIHEDIYNPTFIEATNINLETFSFEKTIGSRWENLLNYKIEKLLFD